ncbi:hypothetical protein SEUCBS139899_003399 [Sporothrix eucalyptigena]
MSKNTFFDDLTTGLKGIRGAGDALRGELLESIDRTFDNNPSHPTTAAETSKNRTIAEQGRAAMKRAEEMVARREQAYRDRKEAKVAGHSGTAGTAETAVPASAAFDGSGAQAGAVPVATHETTSDAYTGTGVPEKTDAAGTAGVGTYGAGVPAAEGYATNTNTTTGTHP